MATYARAHGYTSTQQEQGTHSFEIKRHGKVRAAWAHTGRSDFDDEDDAHVVASRALGLVGYNLLRRDGLGARDERGPRLAVPELAAPDEVRVAAVLREGEDRFRRYAWLVLLLEP